MNGRLTWAGKIRTVAPWKKNAIAAVVGCSIGAMLIAQNPGARSSLIVGSLVVATVGIAFLAIAKLRTIGVAIIIGGAAIYSQSFLLNRADQFASTTRPCTPAKAYGNWVTDCVTLMTIADIPALEGGQVRKLIVTLGHNKIDVAPAMSRADYVYATHPPTVLRVGLVEYVFDDMEINPTFPAYITIGTHQVALSAAADGRWHAEGAETEAAMREFSGTGEIVVDYTSTLVGSSSHALPSSGLAAAWGAFTGTNNQS